MTTPQRGMMVRDRIFGGKHTGTITDVSRDGLSVFIDWHGTIVNEELPTHAIDILS